MQSIEKGKLRQSRYYQAHKDDLKAERRRRYRRKRLNKSYVLCRWCGKKIAPGQWGRPWGDDFYHTACLIEKLREGGFTDLDIEGLKGDNYGEILESFLKSGF